MCFRKQEFFFECFVFFKCYSLLVEVFSSFHLFLFVVIINEDEPVVNRSLVEASQKSFSQELCMFINSFMQLLIYFSIFSFVYSLRSKLTILVDV